MKTPRSGFFLILVVLAITLTCLPVAAAPPVTPLSPGEIGIRQAHLSWISLTREAEMNAALTYIYPLYETNTTRLSTLLADFRTQEALIPATTTLAGFDNLTQNMRSITGVFRDETSAQMTRGHGKWDDLSLLVRASTTNNPYIDEKKVAYWNTRKVNQLEDFDGWVLDTQGSLDILKKQGYNTATAQRTHDVIASKRPDLVAALDAKNDDRILSINQALLPLSQQLGQQTADIQVTVSDGEKFQFYIDEGYRAVARADAIDNNLLPILLDIGPVEPALKKVKLDLAASSKLVRTGNLATTRTQLLLVKTDLKDLSTTYRDIATTADLPPDLTVTLRAMVITLDAMADRMEVSV
jgi:hypothetical protein